MLNFLRKRFASLGCCCCWSGDGCICRYKGETNSLRSPFTFQYFIGGPRGSHISRFFLYCLKSRLFFVTNVEGECCPLAPGSFRSPKVEREEHFVLPDLKWPPRLRLPLQSVWKQIALICTWHLLTIIPSLGSVELLAPFLLFCSKTNTTSSLKL